MLMVMLAVKDRQLQTYDRPWSAPTVGAGKRAFFDSMNHPDNPQAKHPEDFDLYRLGTFNDVTGEFVCDADGPSMVLLGTDTVKKEGK